jgi:hypothetical protein
MATLIRRMGYGAALTTLGALLAVACGGGDEDGGGGGGSGLPSSKAISELTPAETQQLCDAMSDACRRRRRHCTLLG